MTDGDWLSSADPDAMLRFVRDRVTDNDLRKFACACCRRIWHLLMDVRSRQALEVAERFIDGGATEDELKAAAGAALEAAHFDGSNGQ